jgi:hypothetical protein
MNVVTVFPALWGKRCKNSFYLPVGYGKEGIRLCLPVTRKLLPSVVQKTIVFILKQIKRVGE